MIKNQPSWPIRTCLHGATRELSCCEVATSRARRAGSYEPDYTLSRARRPGEIEVLQNECDHELETNQDGWIPWPIA